MSDRPAALASAFEFHSLILRQVSDAIVSIDDKGIVTYLNPAAERRYGVAAAEAVGRPLQELYEYRWLQEGDEARAAEALARDGYWRGENLHVLKDGQVLQVESAVNVLTDEQGTRVGLLAVVRDVTDVREAEEAVRHADRRKDEFLAILAHELRNPLAPIRTAVALLRNPALPEPVRERTRDVIDRQVTQMTRLVDDLLDVSRLSRGKMTLHPEPIVLGGVLDAAIETARPAIEEHRHRLHEQRGTEPVWINGDLARLSQVFANLLNNAAKYTPAGGDITIDVVDGTSAVDVHVIDTGNGIARDHLETVFNLFAQVDGHAGAPAGGLGIGLALARRLVELHGGTLTADSPGVGQGATFTVRLPTVSAPSAATSPRKAARARRFP